VIENKNTMKPSKTSENKSNNLAEALTLDEKAYSLNQIKKEEWGLLYHKL